MNGFASHSICATAIGACLFATIVFAGEPAIEPVLTGLNHPHSVAIRPGGTAEQYEVFVSDSDGRRIVKIRGDQPGTGTDVITGFDREAAPKALIFLDHDHLVVSCDKQPLIRMYELSDEVKSTTADNTKQVIDEPAVQMVSAFARTRQNDKVPDMLVVACLGDRWIDGLGKIPIRAGTLGKLTPLVGTVPLVAKLSRCVAVSEQGHVVAGQQDAEPNQCLLTFYDPATGKVDMSFPAPITNSLWGLAYNPSNHNLYAVAHTPKSQGGGLYRLDDASEPGKPGCKMVKIAALDFATDLAFAQDGTLYITASQERPEPINRDDVLLRVRGDL